MYLFNSLAKAVRYFEDTLKPLTEIKFKSKQSNDGIFLNKVGENFNLAKIFLKVRSATLNLRHLNSNL